jgi:hypothetical protein
MESPVMLYRTPSRQFGSELKCKINQCCFSIAPDYFVNSDLVTRMMRFFRPRRIGIFENSRINEQRKAAIYRGRPMERDRL